MKLIEVSVHGGYAKAWSNEALVASNQIPTECNAYCQPDLHCDVMYAPTWASAERIKEAAQKILSRWEIVRVEPASLETPPPSKEMILIGDKNEGEPASGWLMFWRKK